MTTAASAYTFQSLPPLPGFGMAGACAYAINSYGDAVGYSGFGALWPFTGGVSKLEPAPPDTASVGHDINDSGFAVGKSFHGSDPDEITTPVIWPASGAAPIGADVLPLSPGMALTIAINNAGRIAGRVFLIGGGAPQSFYYDAGTWHILNPLPGCTASGVKGINSYGDIVGVSKVGQQQSASLWHTGLNNPLELLVARPLVCPAIANAINDNGKAVGKAWHQPTSRFRAVLWHGPLELAQDLGTLPGDHESEALAINNAGVVVGLSVNATTGINRAFVWDSTNGMQYLGDLLESPLPEGDRLSSAQDINDAGQIVGGAFLLGGVVNRAFRLAAA